MTSAQEAHLQRIKDHVCERIDRKYRRGQEEHGGDLWITNCLEEVLDELADAMVYAETAKEQRLKEAEKYGDNW